MRSATANAIDIATTNANAEGLVANGMPATFMANSPVKKVSGGTRAEIGRARV